MLTSHSRALFSDCRTTSSRRLNIVTQRLIAAHVRPMSQARTFCTSGSFSTSDRRRYSSSERLPDNETSVFVLPASATKTSTERVVVMNTVARRVVNARRGIHKDYVFTYRGRPVGKLNNTAWKRAWRLVGLPTEKSILKVVRNLRHTFGRRLRSAGVPLETRKTLLGHANGDITTHYSAAELQELTDAAGAIVNRDGRETPNLMLIGRKTERTVGKVSEMKKRANREDRLTLCFYWRARKDSNLRPPGS